MFSGWKGIWIHNYYFGIRIRVTEINSCSTYYLTSGGERSLVHIEVVALTSCNNNKESILLCSCVIVLNNHGARPPRDNVINL